MVIGARGKWQSSVCKRVWHNKSVHSYCMHLSPREILPSDLHVRQRVYNNHKIIKKRRWPGKNDFCGFDQPVPFPAQNAAVPE